MTNAQRIESMVNELATKTNKPYQTDYNSNYGGWNLYYQLEQGGGCYRGYFGFDDRISTKEMLSYLRGILYALNYKQQDNNN